MPSTRHKARVIALQALYEVDSAGREPEEVMARQVSEVAQLEESRAFVSELVNGVVRNREEIDRNIQKYAPAWPIAQIAIIDRNILRLAIFEILFDNKVPVKVAINEAVELAKGFGSGNSARFINGVLGSLSPLASR